MIQANDKSGVDFRFKVLSAFGIIMIVSGHCYHGGLELMYNWFPPYSYNIALFVFISGYFYKRDYTNQVFRYICKRFKRLIIPAFCWNLFYGFLIFLLSYTGFTIGEKPTLYNMIIMPFVDGEAYQYNLGSWFVYPLFFTSLFNILLRKILRYIKLEKEFIILIIYLAIGIYGINLATEHASFGITGIEKLLIRTMFFLPCFEFGQFYKCVLEKHDTLKDSVYFAIIFVIQIILHSTNENLEYTPSSCSGFTNGAIIPYISALTAIAFWLRISNLLAPILKDKKIIHHIADNTYSIMINHFLGFMLVKAVFLLINKLSLTLIFSDFDIISFKSSIWYYYLPQGNTLWALAYLISGLIVPIVISITLNKIHSRLKNKIASKTRNIPE